MSKEISASNKLLPVGKPKFTLNLQQLKVVRHIYKREEVLVSHKRTV